MKYRRGKLLGFMLTLALVIGLLPVMSLTACAASTELTAETTTWENGDYVVPADGVKIASHITVNGTVNLTLTEDATLTANMGITLSDGATLNVSGKGTMAVNGSNGNTNSTVAGTGTLVLNSGTLTVIGGAGTSISSGNRGTVAGGGAAINGAVTVNGGTLTATGGAGGMGSAAGAGGAGYNGTLTLGAGVKLYEGTEANEEKLLDGNNSASRVYEGEKKQSMYAEKLHTHSFTYTASGATITATCSAEDCSLTDNKATLTILAPTAGGGAAVLSGDVSAFGVSGADIKYAVKNGSTWGEETSTAPSGSGFFKASITAGGVIASGTYGVSAISVASGIEHGSITAPSVATVDAVVPLTITPEVGYELDELRPTKTNGGGLISVHTDDDDNKSFIMPDEEVTVTATFKLKDYKISFYITSGSVTVPETANYENTVRLVISPDEGYGVLSFGIDGVNDWVLVSKDTDTGVEVYTFTMPAQDVSLDVKFAETTIYTIFYKADSTVKSILYRFSSGGAGFKMKSDTKIDDTACWGGQMRGVKGRTSFPISFNINSSYWGVLQDYNVVDNPSSLSSMGNGSAILVEGDDKAFVAQFMWGFYDTDESGELVLREDYGTKYYFVTANTTSISVPNPTRRGYNFGGWSYTNSNDEMVAIDAATGSTTVAIKDNIDKTTIFGAIWKRATSTVTYDLNGGSWSNSNTASVTYGEKLPQPTAPTKDAYAFNGWIVKSKARAIKGSQGVTLTAGSNFDFDTTKITENITLQAVWKHVHSYVNVPLSKVNDLLPGAMPQEYITNYGQYVHFSICSLADDFHLEGHTFDKNGKCACGAERPVEEVTLQETYGDLNMVIQSKPKKDSEVILNAPVMDTKQFVKWEYRSLNGSTWHDLVSTPVVGFIIPDSLRVHAVYESLTEPKLTLKAERYSTDGLLFTMQYALPQGWKATNAAVVYGDNHMLRYMKVVRSNTSWYSITDPFFGIEIVSAGTFDSATYYYDREDNILAKNKNKNKAALRNKILNGEAVNIPGYHEASYKKAQSLGQTSGYAYGGLTGVKDENNGNHYFYVLGFVEYTDASGSAHMAAVGPIAVTYNLTSNEVTDNNVFTYNY